MYIESYIGGKTENKKDAAEDVVLTGKRQEIRCSQIM